MSVSLPVLKGFIHLANFRWKNVPSINKHAGRTPVLDCPMTSMSYKRTWRHRYLPIYLNVVNEKKTLIFCGENYS